MNVEISLSALPADDLSWSDEQKIAAQANGKIDWFLNLGIDPVSCSLTEEGVFQQRAMALMTFSKEIWPKFQDKTARIILAKSALNRNLHLSDECEWDLDRVEEPLRSKMQAMGLFSDYLHRLTSYLPEEAPVTVRIDVGPSSAKSEILVLLSKERFRHIAVDASSWVAERTSATGIVIPEDAALNPQTMQGFEELISWTEMNHGTFRAIPETLLNEEWDGIDRLAFYAPATTLSGKRKALGFAASGGKIISFGGIIGVEGEERVG